MNRKNFQKLFSIGVLIFCMTLTACGSASSGTKNEEAAKEKAASQSTETTTSEISNAKISYGSGVSISSPVVGNWKGLPAQRQFAFLPDGRVITDAHSDYQYGAYKVDDSTVTIQLMDFMDVPLKDGLYECPYKMEDQTLKLEFDGTSYELQPVSEEEGIQAEVHKYTTEPTPFDSMTGNWLLNDDSEAAADAPKAFYIFDKDKPDAALATEVTDNSITWTLNGQSKNSSYELIDGCILKLDGVLYKPYASQFDEKNPLVSMLSSKEWKYIAAMHVDTALDFPKDLKFGKDMTFTFKSDFGAEYTGTYKVDGNTVTCAFTTGVPSGAKTWTVICTDSALTLTDENGSKMLYS